jgi:hypothetical protein
MRFSLLAFSLLLLVSACSKNSSDLPEGILTDSVMTELIVDFSLVDAAYSVSLTSLTLPRFKKELFYEEIVKKHGTTRKQFVESLDYYAQHSKQLQQIYENALKEMSRRQAEAVR